MLLAQTAKMFTSRPSTMLGPLPPLVALALDEALALRLLLSEKKAIEDAKSPSRPWGPIAPGLVYESLDAALTAELDARGQVH